MNKIITLPGNNLFAVSQDIDLMATGLEEEASSSPGRGNTYFKRSISKGGCIGYACDV
jgi:hypothetical protein